MVPGVSPVSVKSPSPSALTDRPELGPSVIVNIAPSTPVHVVGGASVIRPVSVMCDATGLGAGVGGTGSGDGVVGATGEALSQPAASSATSSIVRQSSGQRFAQFRSAIRPSGLQRTLQPVTSR